MEWFLMVFGLAFGLAFGGSWVGSLLGAIAGYVIGLSVKLQRLQRDVAEVRKQIEQFSARFDKGTNVVWQRLQEVERASQVAPGSAPLADATAPVGAVASEPVSGALVVESVHSKGVLEVAPEPDVSALARGGGARPISRTSIAEADIESVADTVIPDAAVQPVIDGASQEAVVEPITEVASPEAADVALSDKPAIAALDTPTADSLLKPGVAESGMHERASPPTPAVPLDRTKAKVVEPVRPKPVTGPSILTRAYAAARDWLFGGNTVLRVGVVLLFLGLAFLLRYASERVVVPVEVRYIGVALAAMVLLWVGWRLRLRRPGYALIVQGAGVAVLYLTTFAAMRLHPLLSPQMAFALLVVVTICSAMLAVLQDALGLAVVATLGGFCTPILTSTGGGNHVGLFSYFTLLNAGIFAIAWFKAWRQLNLVGFLGTFSIGTAWGLRFYAPQHFASTEPFLILFFLMYVAIGLLFAHRKLREAEQMPENASRDAILRWSARQTDNVDGTILFGTPLVGFALQCAVVRHIEFGVAFSALALGLFYMGLARLLVSRIGGRAQLLIETSLALGVIFGTLAIPLALDARWTSASWAVEGAGLYWLGLRQGRRLARCFALFLQASAGIIYVSQLGIGSQTLVEGVPLGALMLGAAMLGSYLQLRRWDPAQLDEWEWSFRPILACAGLGFLYLKAPLCFWVQGTTIAWAVAGLVTIALGLRLPSLSFRGCALLVQAAAGLLYLSSLGLGIETLIEGRPLGSLVLGMALLGSYLLMRGGKAAQQAAWEQSCRPVLACSGLGFLYLIAPVCLGVQGTTIAWALAGLVTIIAGLRLKSASFVGCAFGVQLLAGGLFVLKMPGAGNAAVALAGGLQALVCAGVLGLTLIACAALAVRDPYVNKDDSRISAGLSTVVLIGLVLLNLTVLFALPWRIASAVWGGSGLLVLALGLRIRHRVSFLFGFAWVLVGGLSFVATSPGLFSVIPTEGMAPLAHAGFWTPMAISLAAIGGAWLLHRASVRGEVLAFGDLARLSSVLVGWGCIWWAIAVLGEIVRFVPSGIREHAVVLAASASVLLWGEIARREAWRTFALWCLVLVPTGFLALASAWNVVYQPFVQLGWLAWPGLAAVHLRLVASLRQTLPDVLVRGAHVLGCWLMLIVLALGARHALLTLAEHANAWRWLGLAAIPSLFLAAMGSKRQWLWPVAAFAREYRGIAALPVAVALLIWFYFANFLSSGAAAPLPYLPLVNPLEIGLLIVVLAVYRWLLDGLPILWPEAALSSRQREAFVGILLFAVLTMTVCRTVHHWGGVAFESDALLRSMAVQAALSILWAMVALGLMTVGHVRVRRDVWVTGAALISVVVVKLFLVELGDSGSLGRIFSFISVGVLMLIVGYFAPLPPKRQLQTEAI